MFTLDKRMTTMLLVLLYRLSLDMSYFLFVSKLYEYNGFYFNPNGIKIFESYVLTLLIPFILNQNDHKVSVVTTKLLYVLLIIPTLALYGLNNGPRLYVYSIFLGFVLTLLFVKLPNVKLPKIKINRYVVLSCVSLITVVTYIDLIKLNGIPSLKAFNLLSVYEIRSQVKFGSAIMGYMVVWQAKVINLFFLGIGLYRKNKLVIILSLALQVLLFLILGSKLTLFAPFMVLAIDTIIKNDRFLKRTLIGLTSLILISLIVYLIGLDILPASMFIRRLLFVPAINNFYYYDFFSSNPKTYLSHSIFKSFLDYPYTMPVANIIGERYYSNPASWINTGYLADAFMNFGYIGIMMFSIILGFILKLLDSILKNSNQTIALCTSIVGMFSLLDGGLFTVLLTHGVLISLSLLYLYANIEKR